MNFQEAEQKFQELEKKWSAGQLSPEAYQAVLTNLQVVDSSGLLWMIQAHTGRWFVFRAGQWVEAPLASPPPPPRPQPAAPPAVPLRPTPPVSPARKRSGLSVPLILGLLSICLVCGVIGIGSFLLFNGQLPAQFTRRSPQSAELTPGAAPEIARQVESIAITADGAPHADSRGVSLAVPAEALAEEERVNLQANELAAPWLKVIEPAVSIDTPFYNLAAHGKNDTAGTLSLSFPAANPNARILAVIDNEYLVELAQTPQDGKLTLQTRAGPTDTTDLKPPEGYDGTGSIYYAVITPKSKSSQPSNDQMISLRHAQADERNCIPDISVIGGAAINLCRQNSAGTIQVMLPTTKRDLLPQVDSMVDKIETVMNKYYSLGFTTAQLSHSAPMLVRVSTKVTNPSYYPLNGVLYIPVDTVTRIATLSPTDVYHEMAHWIQAVKYSTRLAYWSGERTWWLETAAENMVMLVEPAYVGSNLQTYGTISAAEGTLALQASPYQWPGDFYVQSQLVKVNLCDAAACPLSPASFARAISEGTYPLMNGGAKSQISSNLKDYAFYLLGKPPASANSAIPLSGPVKTGEGYGEYIRITRNSNVDIKYDTNGSEPQMRKETKDGKEAVAVEARLQKDGVYPLMVQGGEGKNPGLPVELIIEPGAPFYYTLDNGELKYSDGSQELKLLPIHGKMGIKKVRLVAMGENGGEIFKARVQPLSLEGAWVVTINGAKSGGAMTCSGENDSVDNPDGIAQFMALIMSIMNGTGDMQADPTGRSLDWNEVAGRAPAQIKEGNITFKATALMAGDAVKYQANVEIPKPDENSSLPPTVPVAAAGAALPFIWLGRKRLNIKTMRVITNVLVVSCLMLVSTGCFGIGMYGSATVDAKFQKIEYVGGQDTGVLTVSPEAAGKTDGKPIWKLTGSATYDVTFNIETTVTDVNGKDTTEITTCTGTVTYPVMAYVFKDFKVVLPSE